MARPPRHLLDGGCYHLIARGNNRQFLLTEEVAFRYFLDLLTRAKGKPYRVRKGQVDAWVAVHDKRVTPATTTW